MADFTQFEPFIVEDGWDWANSFPVSVPEDDNHTMTIGVNEVPVSVADYSYVEAEPVGVDSGGDFAHMFPFSVPQDDNYKMPAPVAVVAQVEGEQQGPEAKMAEDASGSAHRPSVLEETGPRSLFDNGAGGSTGLVAGEIHESDYYAMDIDEFDCGGFDLEFLRNVLEDDY